MAVFARNHDAVFNQYYNALIEAYNENFGALFGELELSTSEHPIVTQRNLNILRSKIESIYDRALSSMNVSDDNYDDTDIVVSERPHQCALLEPLAMKINNGKGFLVVPGKYNSSGQDIYQYDDQEDYWTSGGRSVPENIPTLYEHFVDIKNVMEKINQFIYGYADLTVNDSKGKNIMVMSWEISDYDDEEKSLSPEQASEYVALSSVGIGDIVSSGGLTIHQQKNTYSIKENLAGSNQQIQLLAIELEKKYEKLNNSDIQDAVSRITSRTMQSGGVISHDAESFDSLIQRAAEYKDVGHYNYSHLYMCTVLQVVKVSVSVDMPTRMSDDTSNNDLMAIGCANITPCTTTTPSPNQIRTIFGSCGNNSSAYLSLYVSALKPKDALVFTMSKDTYIAGNATGQITLDSGKVAKYKFTKLIRPSGVPAIMAWSFSNDEAEEATPVDGSGYVMTENSNGTIVIHFSDGVTHYYNSAANEGSFIAAEKEINGEKISVSFPSCVSTNLESPNFAHGTAEINEGVVEFTYAPGGLIFPVEYGQSYLYSAVFYLSEEDAEAGLTASQCGRIDVSGAGINSPITTLSRTEATISEESINNSPIVFTTRRKSAPVTEIAMPIISILSVGGGGDDGSSNTVFSSSQYHDPETGTVYAKSEFLWDGQDFVYNSIKGDVVTDLTAGEIVYLATAAARMTVDSEIRSLPGQVRLSEDGFAQYYLDEKGLLDMLLDVYYIPCE